MTKFVKAPPKVAQIPHAPQKTTVLLPTEKSKPSQNLHDKTILVYGESKIGKSTLCGQIEDALFLATEAGLKALEVFQIPIMSWKELEQAYEEIKKGEHGFKTIVIDTLDNAYRFCADSICRKYGLRHESEMEYGKGYAIAGAELYSMLNKFASLPYGLVLVAHTQTEDIKTSGKTETRIVPSIPTGAREKVLRLVDQVLYCTLEDNLSQDGKITYERVMCTQASLNHCGGARGGEHLPDTISMSWNALLQAWNRKTDGLKTIQSPPPQPVPSVSKQFTRVSEEQKGDTK